MSVAQHIPESPQLAAAPAPGQAGEFGHRIRNISRQAAVYFFGTILTAAAGYLFKVYLARVLGAEALGLYTLGMSIVGFLGLFNAFGLPASASRFVAEYSSTGDFERLGSFLRGSFALLSAGNLLLGAAVLMLGPWIAVRFYHAPALGGFFWPLTTIMLLGVLNNFLGQCMAGYRDVARRTLITHFIGTPANIVFSVILISLGLGLGGYLTAQVASAALVLALLGISVWRMTPRGARLVRSRARVEKEVVAFSAVAFALTGVDFLLSQTDKIVLGCFLRPRQVGIYAVAMALVAFVPIALQSVNQIFSPVIAELHASGRRLLLQNLYSTLTKWVLILTLPLAIAMVCLARTLMGIFGPGFEAG
ncbi:MAG TPA: oligosaccharide flippase family protein, partial [Terriglobales bacterium]|nr:oligosaccharide flippase family protein [Terriglobales bacterium]